MRFIKFGVLAFAVLEILSLVAAGRWIGIGYTFLLLTGAFIIGFWMINRLGRSAIAVMRGGELTREAFAEAFPGAQLRVAAAILFMTPGFFSDLLALVLMLPPVRSYADNKFQGWMKRHAPKPAGGVIIDGEVTVIEPGRQTIEGPTPPLA